MPENIDNQEDPKRDMHVTTYEGEKNKPDLRSKFGKCLSGNSF